MSYKTVVTEIKAEKIRQYFYKKCIGEINKIFFWLSVLNWVKLHFGIPFDFHDYFVRCQKSIFCDSVSSDSVRVTTLNAIRTYALRIFSKKGLNSHDFE